MKTTTGATQAAIEPTFSPAARSAAVARPAGGPQNTPDLAAVRLVIEEDRESGGFVYKTLDRVTGEVIAQFPRDEVLKMLYRGQYVAGDVIKTRA